MKKVLLLFFTLYCSLFTAYSQNQHLIDSLTTKLGKLQTEKLELRNNNSGTNDTSIVNVLIALSNATLGNNPDKSLDYAKQTKALSEQIGYKRGVAAAYQLMGNFYNMKSDYITGLENYKSALKIRQELGDRAGIAALAGSIANMYQQQDNYPEALKNLFIALKMNRELNNKLFISYNLLHIGETNRLLGNFEEALKSNQEALKIDLELGDKMGIACGYNNLGKLSISKHNYSDALTHFFNALKVGKEMGDKYLISNASSNIADIYVKQGKETEALTYYFDALKLDEELGNKDGIASCYGSIGNLYAQQKKYKLANEYINKALTISQEIGNIDGIRDSYKALADMDKEQNDYKKYSEHLVLYYKFRDSVMVLANVQKTMQMQMQNEYDNKEAAAKAEQDKKDALAKEQNQRHKQQEYALFFCLLMAVGFASWDHRQKKKIKNEKKRSEDLLLNILPAEIAEELKNKGKSEAKQFDNVTVLFTDFVGFTMLAEKLSPKELVKEIHNCFTEFDKIIERNGLEKIKTIGDAYLAVCGLPMEDKGHAKKTVQAAIEIAAFMSKHQVEGGQFKIRIGINSGPVVAGIVGVKKFAYDIWGDAVNTAARMEQHSENGKINISGSTYELVKNDFKCIHRGKIQAKHKGEVDMYFVESGIRN